MPDLTRRVSAFRKSDWLRAGVLCILVILTSTVRPSVLVAVPFLLLVWTNALRGYAILGATLIAIIIVMVGPYDGMWYLERGWALLLGGCFVGLSIVRPKMKISDRALEAVFGALVLVAMLMTLMSGAWNIVDWVISDRIRATVAQVIALGGSEGLAPALMTAFYQTAEVQILIFPALTALASMSALLLSWWLFIFFSGRSEEALGPVKNFRFNDHLIWMLVVGLFLLFTRWSEPLQRLGSNAVVFIGALCAVRGAAVMVFITGGFSVLGYAMTLFGLFIVPPIVLGGAVLIGIADIYLDFRKRSEQLAAR
ncbi:MAG: hypothetical protein ABGY10_08460 [bacterium]|jgi:hypothetical protein|nr:hypothetical protein [Gemmatimonadota bacterium]